MGTLYDLYQYENQNLRDKKNKRFEEAVRETVGYLKDNVTTLIQRPNDFVIVRASIENGLTELVTNSAGEFTKYNEPISSYRKVDPLNYCVINDKEKNEIYKIFSLSEELIQVMNALLQEGLTCALSADEHKTFLFVKVKY